MRPSERIALAQAISSNSASAMAAGITLAMAAASGCAIPLEDRAEPPLAAPGAAPEVPGCRLFRGDGATVTSLGGPGVSLEAEGGGYLWLFDGADTPNGPVSSPGALVAAGAPDDCFASVPLSGAATPLSWLDAAPLGPDRLAAPLDGARLLDGAILYYAGFELDAAAPFGVRDLGYGVARLDPASGRYVAGPPLWTADRPSFGQSVLAQGDTLFVYGCRGVPDTFDTACYVARVASADVNNETAYEYYAGGGNWIDDIERAVPIANAGPITRVRYAPARDRYVMTSVPLLGDAVQVRIGLGPEGPWSRAIDLVACALPTDDPGAVCVGGVQHPEIAAGGPEGLALSYAVISLSEDGAARREALPDAYWPRLVVVPWPDLP